MRDSFFKPSRNGTAPPVVLILDLGVDAVLVVCLDLEGDPGAAFDMFVVVASNDVVVEATLWFGRVVSDVVALTNLSWHSFWILALEMDMVSL